MRLRLSALTLLTAAVLPTFLAALTPAYADNVDNYLKAQMTARHIPGLSVAVVQDGKIVKDQGYGLSDTAAKTPATADTVYQIGSLTKQFTATAILTLMQQGKVGIDDPVSKYVDGLPAAWKPITVRELLNQTSGIFNYREHLDYFGGGAAKEYTAAEVIQLANAKPLAFPPGTRFEYSNTNYHLLGMIIEKVSGHSYGDFMQQTFFGPLGMTHTQMTRPGLTAPLATGTVWDGTAVQSSPIVFSPTINFGDDGIVSCVTDLAKWNAALDGPALLSAGSKRLLWTPPALPGGTESEYASGWFAAKAEGHTLFWHNGMTLAGFAGAIFKLPGDKLTLIVLTNSLDFPGLRTSYPMYALTLGLTKLYIPDLAKEDAGIPDTDPKTAALLRIASAQIAAKGSLDPSIVAPADQAGLTPAVLKPLHDLLAPLGPMTSLTLLRRDPDGSAVYQARHKAATVNWLIVVDKDHKITLIYGRSAPQ